MYPQNMHDFYMMFLGAFSLSLLSLFFVASAMYRSREMFTSELRDHEDEPDFNENSVYRENCLPDQKIRCNGFKKGKNI